MTQQKNEVEKLMKEVMGLAATFDDSIRQRLSFHNAFFFSHLRVLPSLRTSRRFLAEANMILLFDKVSAEKMVTGGAHTIESLLSEKDITESKPATESQSVKQAKK